jgi:predicted glycosyltransferase
MLIWVDVENQPQVQYLLPVLEACRRLGAETVVTARDYGATFETLRSREQPFHPIGAAYGASRPAKVRGLVRRTRALVGFHRANALPDALVCASRAGVLAARRLRIRSYVISDYEYANLTIFRWARSTVLFPRVIGAEAYREAGFPPERLIPFEGLKEDITFANVDLERVEAAPIAADRGRVRVLVRPPAEESHYHKPRSTALYLEALELFASNPEAVVVFVPRYPRQVHDLDGRGFTNPPVVVERPLPFASLLKAVDLVLCSGGTMLREAAYLGIPAYSIFGSELGGVDRYLERIGRVSLLSSSADLSLIKLEHSDELSPLGTNPRLVDEIAALILGADGRREPTHADSMPKA